MTTVAPLIAILYGFCPILAAQQLTLAPAGRMHVQGNSLVDSVGRTIVLKGTEIPDPDSTPPGAEEFSSFSATTFSAIRQRWNMNAIRIVVNPASYLDNRPYRAKLRDAIYSATSLDLVVIIAAEPPSETLAAQLWSECALDFRDEPRVIFEVAASADLVRLIRSKGCTQPILVRGPIPEGLLDVIQEVSSDLTKSPMERYYRADVGSSG